ncbi:unnamed protein product, partial [Discosporangium mesarthrocarpum]
NVAEVIESVRVVGRETGFTEQGEEAALRLEEGFRTIRSVVSKALSGAGAGARVSGVAGGCWPGVGDGKKVAFLEWLEPLFNGGHWIPDLMHDAGVEYSMADSTQRSIQISKEELAAYDPDVILIAPCGFGMARAHADAQLMWRHPWWGELKAVKARQVYALDGNAYYARPGPRLLQGCGIIARLIHGDAVGDMIGEEIAPRDSWMTVEPPP